MAGIPIIPSRQTKPAIFELTADVTAQHSLPNDIIDQIVHLFSQLAHNDQHRCLLRLRNRFSGR